MVRKLLKETNHHFTNESFHDKLGDLIGYFAEDSSCYGVVVDEHLTVYKAFSDDRIVGVEIEGVSHLFKVKD